MAEEINDSDSSSCEWSLVSNEGEVETLNAVAEFSNEVNETVKEYGISSSTEEPKISADKMLKSEVEKESKDSLITEDIGESDTSSDIEKIDEPPTIQTSLESSRFSNFSEVNPLEYLSSSFLIGNNDQQISNDSKSDASLEDSAIQILLSGKQVRSYRHTPNQQLNITLNILLGLTVAAVIGLGIGHFIGWSNQWLHQRNLQQNHLSTLNQLEEELRNCLQKQQEILIDNNLINLQPCYEKADHWKQQLNKILLNKNFDNLMTGSQNINQCNEEDTYQKLKSEFLHKQMEHIEAVKQFEQIKSEERKFRQKFKSLEDENNDLKIKLEMEEEEDSEEQMILYFIMKENIKLRLTIDNLQNDLQDNSQESIISDKHSNKAEIGKLREQINQLQTENEDLRQVIARLRYSQALNSKLSEEIQNKFNQLETENMDLKMEIGKMRYSKPVDSLKSNFKKESNEKIDQNDNINDDLVENYSGMDENLQSKDSLLNEQSNENNPENRKYDEHYIQISNYLHWIKGKVPWLEKDDEKLFDTFINKTLANYWQKKNDFNPQDIFIAINESLINILNFLHQKWETVQNLTISENQPVGNKSFFGKILSIWEEAKIKLVNAMTTSKQKLREKPWNKFIKKMQILISTVQKKLLNIPKRHFDSRKESNQKANSFRSNVHDNDGSSNKYHNDEFTEKIGPHVSNLDYPTDDNDWKVPNGDLSEKKWKKKPKNVGKKKENHDSSWIFKRAEYREKKKQKERQADWVFDRARDRAKLRQSK